MPLIYIPCLTTFKEDKMCLVDITKTRLFKYIENFTNKNCKFSDKNSDNFHISYFRGGSNEYPQSMSLSRNKKNNVYPCKPQIYDIKVGFKGVKIVYVCFRDVFRHV